MALAGYCSAVACGIGVSRSTIAGSIPTLGWERGSVLLRSDYPTVVGADAHKIYALIAPFLRGVLDDSSGIVAIDKNSGATEYLFKSGATILPNHMAPVLGDGGHLYWLNGLRIMQTDTRMRSTRQLSEYGSLALGYYGAELFSFNHDNNHRLLRIDCNTGQAQTIATLDLVASDLYADGKGVLLLTSPSSRRAQTSVVFQDYAGRAMRDLVGVSDVSIQIRACAPYTAATETQKVFSGFYYIETDTRRGRALVKHYDLTSGTVTSTGIDRISDTLPFKADSRALYFFRAESRELDASTHLFRLVHGSSKAQKIDQGSTQPRSLLIDGKQVYWSDLNRIYSLALS